MTNEKIEEIMTNAVGIDFGGYGRIWFNANAWLKG